MPIIDKKYAINPAEVAVESAEAARKYSQEAASSASSAAASASAAAASERDAESAASTASSASATATAQAYSASQSAAAAGAYAADAYSALGQIGTAVQDAEAAAYAAYVAKEDAVYYAAQSCECATRASEAEEASLDAEEGAVESFEHSVDAQAAAEGFAEEARLHGMSDAGAGIHIDRDTVQMKSTASTVSLRRLKRLGDYMYEAWYDSLDYWYADKYFKENDEGPVPGACSSIRQGNYLGRNFDWMYSEQASVVVHTPASAGRHAVMGVSGTAPGVTEALMTSGEYDRAFGILPFYIVDGINDAGVACSSNVVPTGAFDGVDTTVVLPTGVQEASICSRMLVRYILDNFSSAQEAVNWLQQHARIYQSQQLVAKHYELHYLLADSSSTYILEFAPVDGTARLVASSRTGGNDTRRFMTNFHVTGVTTVNSGKVYTPADKGEDPAHDPVAVNGVKLMGSGLERWNILNSRYSASSTESGMAATLSMLKYTNAYRKKNSGGEWEEGANPRWDTEFVGTYEVGSQTVELTCANVSSDFEQAHAGAALLFENRSRTDTDPGTWQTVHSAIYSIKDKTLKLAWQENMDSRTLFKLEQPLQLDSSPRSGSTNAVSSGGVYNEVQNLWGSVSGKYDSPTDMNVALGSGAAAEEGSTALGSGARAYLAPGSVAVGTNVSVEFSYYGVAVGTDATVGVAGVDSGDYYNSSVGAYSAAMYGSYCSVLGAGAYAGGNMYNAASHDIAIGFGATSRLSYAAGIDPIIYPAGGTIVIGPTASCCEGGVTCISAMLPTESGVSTSGQRVQLYLIAPGTRLSALCLQGEAGIGYTVYDTIMSQVTVKGFKKLSALLDEDSTDFNPMAGE